MNYLIVFDPATGHSDITEYPDTALEDAMRDRLQAELAAFKQGARREIVVMNARSIDDLRETHARYFGDDFLRVEVRRLIGDPPAA